MKIFASTDPKLSELMVMLKRLSPVALAYSGGLDSRFLAFVAENSDADVHLYNICGPHISTDEAKKAKAWAIARRIDITCLPVNVLMNPKVAANDDDRCYHCKKMLIEAIMEASGVVSESGRRNKSDLSRKYESELPCGQTWQPEKDSGVDACSSLGEDVRPFPTVCDGSNLSDLDLFRPGIRALTEYGIWSPLAACGINKSDIRRIAVETGLEDPAQKAKPCLLTRFAYMVPADEKALISLDHAERRIGELLSRDTVDKAGLPEFRLRVFGPVNQPGMVELHIQDSVSMDAAEKLAAEAVNFGFASPAIRILENVSGWHDRHRALL